MATVEEAQTILKALGLPQAQQTAMSGYTLLALCGLTPTAPWYFSVRTRCTVTKGVMDYIRETYAKAYAPNTRETFRRFVLHQFVQARVADYNPFEPNLPTNSPKAHYAITEDALSVVKAFGQPKWRETLADFVARRGSLTEAYEMRRDLARVPITLPDGTTVRLSPGAHNEVQKAVIEQFAERFAPGARLLYLGDTADKELYRDVAGFALAGMRLKPHDKLPDVVLFDEKRRWLFMIEAVTSHGPMSPKRMVELRGMMAGAEVGAVYVSAFPDMDEFKKWMSEIAWETEVWIANRPDHMVHFNGDRFMGPRD